jgi:hypothetical protein
MLGGPSSAYQLDLFYLFFYINRKSGTNLWTKSWGRPSLALPIDWGTIVAVSPAIRDRHFRFSGEPATRAYIFHCLPLYRQYIKKTYITKIKK